MGLRTKQEALLITSTYHTQLVVSIIFGNNLCMYNVYEQDQVITSWYNKDLINMHNAGDMSKQYVLNVWCPRFDHLVLTRIVYISIRTCPQVHHVAIWWWAYFAICLRETKCGFMACQQLRSTLCI